LSLIRITTQDGIHKLLMMVWGKGLDPGQNPWRGPDPLQGHLHRDRDLSP